MNERWNGHSWDLSGVVEKKRKKKEQRRTSKRMEKKPDKMKTEVEREDMGGGDRKVATTITEDDGMGWNSAR